MHRVLAIFLCLAALPAPALALGEALAQGEAAGPGADGRAEQRRGSEVQVYAYTLRYQPIDDVEALVRRYLTRRGSVELQRRTNTVVVRDTLSAISRIMPVLRRYDHPPRTVEVEVMIVRANRSAFSPVIVEDELPPALLESLRRLLPYSSYVVRAKVELTTIEGEAVMYEMGEGFAVSFRLGTVLEGKVKLHDFKVMRTEKENAAPQQLFKSNLNLPMEKPSALGLASNEAARTALMVVLIPQVKEGG